MDNRALYSWANNKRSKNFLSSWHITKINCFHTTCKIVLNFKLGVPFQSETHIYITTQSYLKSIKIVKLSFCLYIKKRYIFLQSPLDWSTTITFEGSYFARLNFASFFPYVQASPRYKQRISCFCFWRYEPKGIISVSPLRCQKLKYNQAKRWISSSQREIVERETVGNVQSGKKFKLPFLRGQQKNDKL